MATKDVAALIRWAEDRGWVHEGTRGNGHPALRWRDGSLYTIASSPSDWRNAHNARAEISRIDGKPLDHVKRGKARHVRGSGFSMAAALAEQRAHRAKVKAAEQAEATRDAERSQVAAARLERNWWARESRYRKKVLRTLWLRQAALLKTPEGRKYAAEQRLAAHVHRANMHRLASAGAYRLAEAQYELIKRKAE